MQLKTATVAATVGIAAGIGGTLGFESLRAPAIPPLPKVSEREELLELALSESVMALDQAVQLNANQEYLRAIKDNPDLAKQMREKYVFPPTQATVKGVEQQLELTVSDLALQLKKLGVSYPGDYWKIYIIEPEK